MLDTDKQNIKADCKTNTKQEMKFELNENNNKYIQTLRCKVYLRIKHI
jgi:hypothetical protein